MAKAETKDAGLLLERCPLVSSDSHILETADLWTERVEPRFRDRAPVVVRVGEHDHWHADNTRFHSVRSTGFQAGVRFTNPEELSLDGRFESIRPGGLDPHPRVKDMDTDGVAAEVLYPTVGLQMYRIGDPDLFTECARAYNDHIADFCKAYPQRLKGVAVLNVDSITESIRELERSVKLGLVGALIPVSPYVRYDHPSYEQLWAAAAEIGVPLTLHIGTERAAQARPTPLDPIIFSTGAQDLRTSIAALIFGGALERHPKLKIVAAEFEISWALYLLNRMDDTYKNRVAGQKGPRFKSSTAVPSDFFRRQVSISFQEDDVGIQTRHSIGVDHLMWGADYPHAESTWPRSMEIVDEIFGGVPADEKVKITRENTVSFYGFDLEGVR